MIQNPTVKSLYRFMATNWTICGTCDFQHITKSSVCWCSECDEGLCHECSEHHSIFKATRGHSTIAIDDYKKLPSTILEITHTCKDHNEKIHIYCKQHDCPCCKKCIVETHNECKEFVDIDDVVKNVKSSNAFVDIEHTLVDISENIKRIRKDREVNLIAIQETRKKVESEIKMTKLKIVSYLDRLQEDILSKLSETEESESKRIQKLLTLVQQTEKDVTEYQHNMASIKQYASDLQAFLILKHIEHDVEEKDTFIQRLVKNKDLNLTTLSWKISSGVENFQTSLKKFGNIVVESKSSGITIASRKDKQAQIMVMAPSTISLDKIKLKLKKTVSTRGTNITGCSLFSNGTMIFSSYEHKKIIVLTTDGSWDRINYQWQTFDVKQIDGRLLAITTGYEGDRIILRDLLERKTKKIIEVGVSNDGIAVSGDWLYFCARKNGLMRVNIIDGSISEVVKEPMSGCAYIAVFDMHLYFTNKLRNTVTCCDLEGNIKWIFKDESTLSFPLGISVDNYCNIYVVGNEFSRVVVISPDGKQSKVILSSTDGLDCPQVLHYNRENNQLLVGNKSRHAFLFGVIFE
ncbi:PML [Mytilus edulis]|uniref:PML n=1 Tax=Mytilus edulis TaxID=6550 RepID=A0A8S3VBF7_MYTED|nr:PML [Mytilus edulis]